TLARPSRAAPLPLLADQQVALPLWADKRAGLQPNPATQCFLRPPPTQNARPRGVGGRSSVRRLEVVVVDRACGAERCKEQHDSDDDDHQRQDAEDDRDDREDPALLTGLLDLVECDEAEDRGDDVEAENGAGDRDDRQDVPLLALLAGLAVSRCTVLRCLLRSVVLGCPVLRSLLALAVGLVRAGRGY